MRLLFCVLSLAALAGCTLVQSLESEGAIDGALTAALGAARAPIAEQKVALARAQQRFADDPVPASRLGLATMLATLPPPLRDDARAAELLEPLADSGATGTARFAAFLAAQVSERQRLLREIDKLAREGERLAREREKGERERASADKERDKREEAMRQQLEALRAIERGILEREERLRRKPR